MTRPLVFIIDDNRSEIEFAELAFAESGVAVELVGFLSAEAALTRVRALNEDARAPLPQLVLLDLNMPRVHGMEILAYLRGAPRWQHVPVVVLTTSNAPKEREQCLALGASDFLVKPPRMEAYLRLMRSLHRYLVPSQEASPPGSAAPPSPPTSDHPATPPA